MDFKILGPLEVVADGAQVPLGGPKPRRLMAVLLLNRNRVVSTDRLVDLLWAADRPSDAVAGLRSYVSRLRTVLGEVSGRARLEFQAPGYRLTVSDDELDAARFERMMVRARQVIEAGDDAGAERLLAAALGLWRGPALADVELASGPDEAELARLEELRLAATEHRAEALLHLGGAGELVAELDALVRRYPEREPLSCLLMQALYLAGRQAEAFEVYHRLRQLLVDELGVEPSEPTRRLHQRLLEQDPALIPAGTAPADTVPRRGTTFVGRGEEITAVTAALRTAPLVTITGVGGVGKTRVAEEVARAARGRFPDGVWWCELAPLADNSRIGHAVSAALRVRDRPGLTIEQSLLEYLRRRRLLLVLDNCEHVIDQAAGLARELVTHCPGVAVLATSREILAISGEQVQPLRPLPVADAAQLFVDRARAIRPDVGTDPADRAVTDICRRLDGLPLAIELAAARIRAMSPAEVSDRLSQAPLLVSSHRDGNPRHHSLTATLDWSYRLLSAAERRLFARLSVFSGGADLAAVHAVCADPGSSEIDTLDLVTALLDKSLITSTHGPGGTRYGMLETLRSYAREQLPGDPTPAHRHAVHYVELAERAAHGVQGPDEQTWIDRATPDYGNVRAALDALLEAQDPGLALRLVASLPEVSQIRVGYEAADWAERALDLAQEKGVVSHPQYPAAVGAAARGAWNRGDFSRARRLAGLAAGRVPPRGTARTGYPADVLADVALYEGDVEQALQHYRAETERARGDGDVLRLVWTLYYVAICHAVLREPEAGRPAAQECFDLAESTGNPTARSMGHYALGLVLKKAEPDRALQLFERAARPAASVRNFWWQGIALMEVAATRSVHGDQRLAAREFSVVLEHWDRVGDQTQQWLNLRYIVRLLFRLGAGHDALALHHCLLAAGRSSPLSPDQAAALAQGSDTLSYRAAVARGSLLTLPEAVRAAQLALHRHH